MYAGTQMLYIKYVYHSYTFSVRAFPGHQTQVLTVAGTTLHQLSDSNTVTRHHLSDWGARISWHTPPAALGIVDLAQWEGCWFPATAPTPATQSSVYLYPPPNRSGTLDLPHAPFPSASNTQAIFSRDRVWQGCPWRDRWGRIPQLHIPIAWWWAWWGTEAIQSTTVPS